MDVWLKLRAEPITNPPNERSLRKFEAGNVFEWIVSLILRRAGILQMGQKWAAYQYAGLLPVTGKADFIAGGKPDIEKWKSEMEMLDLPEVFFRAGEAIIKHLQEKYPNGLEEMPLEVKSISAFMFDALERRGSASKNHRLQGFHYLKANGYEKTNIVYICRDDLRIREFLVTKEMEPEYREAIEAISKYHYENEQPPLEEAIVFDEDLGKFAKNFKIAYSGYLTKLYGFKDQAEFDAKYLPIVTSWNRVAQRVKDGKNMTDKNKEALLGIEKAGFDIERILPYLTSNVGDVEEVA